MKNKKLNLNELKVQSFVTSLDGNRENTIKGGSYDCTVSLPQIACNDTNYGCGGTNDGCGGTNDGCGGGTNDCSNNCTDYCGESIPIRDCLPSGPAVCA